MISEAETEEGYLPAQLDGGGVVKVRSYSTRAEQSKRTCLPLWMRWKESWGILVAIVAIVGVSVYNFSSSDASLRFHARESVEDLAKTYGAEITRQIRVSVSSIQALEAIIKIDRCSSSLEDFESLASTLITTYKGISNLQLAPFGIVTYIHPLLDETQDNRGALGHNLLLDPGRKEDAIRTIRDGQTVVVGPLKLLQGGIAAIARRPIFTRWAPRYLPDSWFYRNGENHTRNCSDTQTRNDEECYFPGPPEPDGTPTYFWGFATMLTRIEDLLASADLSGLEQGSHKVSGISKFSFQLYDLEPHPSLADVGGIWQQSSSSESLSDGVEAAVSVEEYGFHWVLKIAPFDGWPVVSEDFWRQLLLVLPMTALLGVGLGVKVLLDMRKNAQKMDQRAKYKEEKIANTILGAVSSLNHFQFPMCVLSIEDFKARGRLIQHEEARGQGLLYFFDDPDDVAITCEAGLTFVSHQWAGFEHPDPQGVQFRAMRAALEELAEKVQWIWVDYSSIPQTNSFLQQNAINSLCVYATCCSIFLAVAPPCVHADTQRELNLESYLARAWCRLEKLSYETCTWNAGEHRAYLCDGMDVSQMDMSSKNQLFPQELFLDVLGGTFSCCSRCHPNGMACDKEKIKGVMLGIYWRLLCARRDCAASFSTEDTLQLIGSNMEKYFPAKHEKCTEAGLTSVELFGGYLPTLEKLFEEDSSLDEGQRIEVSGIFHPLGSIPLEGSRLPAPFMTKRFSNSSDGNCGPPSLSSG
ncbi:unnamed protein product [Effrenium voratum]|uniref:CHASE domain-containing protein n=1 Tax=Effrenium voratum TaxID=2562239 RepID=A0AA36IZF2_9DINO|nr:unnamed protein product [Effrenium voratum]CAJ1440951.1 unnamed protein product [Effrenium voratum]